MVDFERLAASIERALDGCKRVPLLVLRLPDRALERATLAAFRRASRCVLRQADVLAHSSGSDRFAIGMTAPAREGGSCAAAEIRTALERIAAAISISTGRQMETGWWIVESRAEIASFARTLDAALERGARERERHAMLATVGHELRTPLTSIRGYIETLLEGEELDPQTTRRFLETARREALRLGRLVEGMLEFSMLDVSERARAATCDVVEQIRATIDAAVPLAHERRVTIRARLARSAPARIDGDACVHALLNVIENAVKHGREGGRVAVECVREDAFICVSVDDDGPGVMPRERDEIFEMGVRGAAATRPGNGIGLAVVRAIVSRAGGDVSVHASPLGGARFILRFPEALPPGTA